MSENKSNGTSWIYTDVVCDLFHFGHVEFFKAARALGDRLVVGIVSDIDATTYKPAPIMTFEERVAVVRGCRYVDRVLDAPAPLQCTPEFLDQIGADFCCHGDDMSTTELTRWYQGCMAVNRLKTVRYTSAISSREIVRRTIDRMRDGTLRRE